MKIKHNILVLTLILLALSLTGCKTQPKRIPPNLSLYDVLTPYNDNIKNIKPFYANLGSWKSPEGSGSGDKLFYYPPTDETEMPKVYLQFDAPFNKKAIIVVSDHEYYGMQINVKEKQGCWGLHKNIGKPCSKTMPVGISSFMETLTLKTIPTEKIITYKTTDKYNIIEYINQDDVILYLHEVFFDRFENIPKKICIYSVDGKKIIESSLDKFKKTESGPVLPTQIRLDYLPDDMFLELKIKNYKINNKNKDLLFKVALEQVKKFEQLDKDCPEE